MPPQQNLLHPEANLIFGTILLADLRGVPQIGGRSSTRGSLPSEMLADAAVPLISKAVDTMIE
jgi:hypothetical protein